MPTPEGRAIANAMEMPVGELLNHLHDQGTDATVHSTTIVLERKANEEK
ncbi:MAG: hypothetical protein LBU38_08025 [Propionibacteriaceae bacterium]|nr:hypothetical protein [Propionibacteriaceae bacterium]